AAAAGVAALFQETLRSSLFKSLEPFSKLVANDDESTSLYTGFPSYAVAQLVLDLADPGKKGTLIRAAFGIFFIDSLSFMLQYLG
ncbi:unnamed protein product, partial [Rotaria sp. Silwood2]